MRRKFLACILALAMTCSLGLSACAKVEPTPPTPPASGEDDDHGGGGSGSETPPKPDDGGDDKKPDGGDDTKPDDGRPVDPKPEDQHGISISAEDVTILAGKYFDPFDGVVARDGKGNDITPRTSVSGNLDTSREGTYFLTYTATDASGNKGKKTRQVTVTENEELGKTQPVFIYKSDEAYNIAQGCDAWASSEYGANTAAKAVDGKETSRWESVHGLDDVTYTLDLGAILPIESVVIVWEDACAKRFELLISNDDKSYEAISYQQDFGKGGERTFSASLAGKSARYVRVRCMERYTQYGYSIYELRVFGKRGTVIPMEKYPVLFDAENSSSPDWKIPDEQWLIADMGASKSVERVEISWKDGLSPASSDIEISTNGSDYTPVSCDNGGYFLQNNTRASVTARYIRINMHSRRFSMNAYRITQLGIQGGGQTIKSVTLSASSAGEGHPASAALENYATYWESAHSASPQTVDLGKVCPVGRVDLFWKGDDGRKGKYYDLQVSSDGETFTTVFRQTHGGTQDQSVYVFEDARYLRIIDYQNTDDTRFMLEGMKVHSQYPNEQKVDYDTHLQFPAFEEVETQNGSYLTGGTSFPTAKLVTYLDARLRDKPVPSNDWWQSLLINDKGHNMYLNPLTAKFDDAGLWLTDPGDGYYSGDYPGNGRQTIDVDAHDLRIGYARTGRDSTVRVVDYSDYSVTCVMSDTDGVDKMTAYLAQGALYGYFFFAEPQGVTLFSENLVGAFDLDGNRILEDGKTFTGDAIVLCVRTHASYENDVERGNAKTYEERFYVVSVPENTAFVLSENTVKLSMKEGNFLSVGAMSTVNTVSAEEANEAAVHGAMNKAEAALMHGHGYAFVVGTRCDMRFDGEENLVKTQYLLQVCSVRGEEEAYTAFLPHQYKKSQDTLAENHSYPTVRGDCRAHVGNYFETRDKFYGIVPQFTLGGTMSEETLLDLINILYKNMGGEKEPKDCNLINGDPYWQGKNLHPMAMAVLAADQIGAADLRDSFLDKIEYVFEDWFNYTPGNEPHDAYFYYDSEWGTLYYKNSEFGAGVNLADHHFTYGYYTFAAGVLSAYRPAFAQKYGDMIELLIRDYMNWEREDGDFPFMRNFDVFAGHGWAGGYADNDGGNNQESVGEALNSWVGAYLYATAIGNDVIRETAICGFTTELNAVKQYWFNYDKDSFADFYPYGALGQLYGASNFFGTFFNGEPLFAYGIHLIPGEEFITSYAIGKEEQAKLSAVMEALKRDQASWNFADAASKMLHAWQHIFIPVTACYDAAEAIAWYDELVAQNGNIGNDNEQFNVYYMIHALESLGTRTSDIWAADGASATVYEKDGAYTAVIWNPTAETVRYTFRNEKGEVGHALVPACSLVSCDPCKETDAFAKLLGVDAFGVGDYFESENISAGPPLTFLEGGSVKYALAFGTASVYRRAVIKATGPVRLLIDGREYPLEETEKGYVSAPISLMLGHTAVLEGSGVTVDAFTFEKVELHKITSKLTATASSENGANRAANAVDGNNSTRWESVHGHDGEYLEIALSDPAVIYSMTIFWEAASAKEYTVSFSATGKEGEWTEVYHGFSTQGERTDTIVPSEIMEVKYIRIFGISRTTSYGYSIFEVNFFGI